MDSSMTFATPTLDIWYGGSTRQNRWTVAFRIILAVPQLFVLYFLNIAAEVVAFIGWFGALFMGRLPSWAHDFLSGWLRWTTRVYGYVMLMTDRYPPFDIEDQAYPVRPIVPAPGPLNRGAVFFRIVLVIPAAFLMGMVAIGFWFPLGFVIWLATLIKGEMPPSLYRATAALVRFYARVYGYFYMVTPEYAWGLFGDARDDDVPPAPPWAPPVPPPTVPPPPGAAQGWAPPGPPPGSEVPAPFAYPSPTEPSASVPPAAPPPGTVAPSGPPTADAPSQWERAHPRPEPPPPDGAWRQLVLQGAARGVMIFALVWGCLVTVGYVAAVSVAASHTNTNNNTGIIGNTGSSGSGSTGTTGSTGNTP